MMKILLTSIILASVASCVTAGDFVLTKPNLACPNTELGNDVLQEKYVQLWAAFDQAVRAATEEVEAELAMQSHGASSAGNLDLAIFWKELTEGFGVNGGLKWDAAVLEREWTARFGKAAFPKSFLQLLEKTKQSYTTARAALAKGYSELEVELTKAQLIDQAIAIRQEGKELVRPTLPTAGAEVAARDVGLEPGKQKGKPEKIIDLMPHVQLEGPTTVGIWKRVGRTIHCDAAQSAKTPIRFDVPDEYDYAIHFVAVRGASVHQIGKFSEGEFNWEMRMWGKALPVFGFRFGNQPGHKNRTSMTWPDKLPPGKMLRSVVQVRRDSITAFFEEKQVSRVELESFPQLGNSELWQVGDNSLGLGSWTSSVIFHRIFLVPVQGER